MSANFLTTIREMNIKSLVAREQQVSQAERHLQAVVAEAARIEEEASLRAKEETAVAFQPIACSRLLQMEAQFEAQAMLQVAEQWATRARERVQRVRQAAPLKIEAMQERAVAEADEAARAFVRLAQAAAQAWDERLKLARRELDTLVALENPDEALRDQFESQFQQTVVRRWNAAIERLSRRMKLAEEKRQVVLARHAPRLEMLRDRLVIAVLYGATIEDRATLVVQQAQEKADQHILDAQSEAEEIRRLAAPQLARAEEHAAELKANAAAQGELKIRLAEAALEEARAELEEARRLAPEAAHKLDGRREAEVLRKKVGRLARAGQITDAMVALAQAKALEPDNPYLPGCEKAVQIGIEAQRVKDLVKQIEIARGVTQLECVWAEAEKLGITHRVESIWKGRMRKLQEAQKRMDAWTNRYATNVARYIVEPGQTVMMHKERPGLVFVLDSAKSVVQLHRMERRGCWKTIAAPGCKVDLAELVAPQM